jgi:hypothetical protein
MVGIFMFAESQRGENRDRFDSKKQSPKLGRMDQYDARVQTALHFNRPPEPQEVTMDVSRSARLP